MSTFTDDDLLLQRFYHHCKTRPNDVYLTQPHSGGQTIDYTFSEVLVEAKRMAAYLGQLGLPTNSKIAMITKNCAHFFITDLAIWMAGHVSVALYPTLNADTVRYILEHSDSRLVFVGKLDTWPEVQRGIPEDMQGISMPLAPETRYPTWDDTLDGVEPIEGEPLRDADDHALIIYTSGSTGKSKGVLHSFRNLAITTKGLIKVLEGTKDDRTLSYLPLAHGMDRWLSECASLYAGSHIYFAESLATFVDDLKRAKPTLFVSVPRLWLKFQLGVFAKMPPKRLEILKRIPILGGIVKKKILANLGLDHVRFAGSGSAPIPAELLTWYRELGIELLEGYGMSENFNYSHLTMPGRGRAGYIGHPYPEVECKLSDEGEILIKSPGSMLGYYKQPELTSAAFTEEGFLRTGDRGEIDSDGRLKITGRVKELFKTSKGKYVSPAPIENLINRNPYVELSLVAGSGMPLTHVVVQVAEELLPDLAAKKAEITSSLEALLTSVNDEIEVYEKIGFIVVAKDRWTIEGNQLTPTQKIRRSAIEAMYTDKLDAWYGDGAKVIWES
jgi:long-chain acyl-CoA synthetase